MNLNRSYSRHSIRNTRTEKGVLDSLPGKRLAIAEMVDLQIFFRRSVCQTISPLTNGVESKKGVLVLP
jgi:hypothetical protein